MNAFMKSKEKLPDDKKYSPNCAQIEQVNFTGSTNPLIRILASNGCNFVHRGLSYVCICWAKKKKIK